jgi:nitroimidazol reductase NimA-like FMN-containing flavoprotein (pyridoxamine 5'-phosphate oxidase superfamily)
MKIIQATPEMPGMTDVEVKKFLESKLNMRLGTVDERGNPNIHPVWFYFDNKNAKLHALTGDPSKKLSNIRRNPNVYFCIDDENFPPKGVKGKGVATISEDISANISMMEKIYTKYLGTLEHPLAKMRLENVKKGNSIILDITPKFFSTWDLSKAR